MGVVANISSDSWPKQGSHLGKRVRVCFNYDTSRCVMGTVVRDDNEAPWLTVISLDSGKVVLATECQYSLEK
jgi:hypothetical protein